MSFDGSIGEEMENEKAKKVLEIYIEKLDELYTEIYSEENQAQVLLMADVINILRKEFNFLGGNNK